jgi:hypothetical protein
MDAVPAAEHVRRARGEEGDAATEEGVVADDGDACGPARRALAEGLADVDGEPARSCMLADNRG